jgi:hypothetical protein
MKPTKSARFLSGGVMLATRVTPRLVLNIVSTAALHYLFWPRVRSGQKETKNHVRCHGSFRRKQSWRPHSQDRAEYCPSKVRQAAPRRAGGRSACVLEHDPCVSIARPLSAHQRGCNGHGAGAQCACPAPASRSDSLHQSDRPADAIPSRRPNDPRQHARQRRAVARRVVLAVPPPGDLECRSVVR